PAPWTWAANSDPTRSSWSTCPAAATRTSRPRPPISVSPDDSDRHSVGRLKPRGATATTGFGPTPPPRERQRACGFDRRTPPRSAGVPDGSRSVLCGAIRRGGATSGGDQVQLGGAEMTALSDALAKARADGRAALIGYLPVGYPSVE